MMAKKRQNSINNNLKKLFLSIGLIAIFLAVPLTVWLSQQPQNTQQEAATVSYPRVVSLGYDLDACYKYTCVYILKAWASDKYDKEPWVAFRHRVKSDTKCSTVQTSGWREPAKRGMDNRYEWQVTLQRGKTYVFSAKARNNQGRYSGGDHKKNTDSNLKFCWQNPPTNTIPSYGWYPVATITVPSGA